MNGSSINLTDSENSTRIVSIHTSKGDGRNVVFVIGLDEKSLIKYSNESNNLVYDSLIHVSLTRMKKKLYIRFINNGDDISTRILKYIHDNNISIESDVKPNLNISTNIKYKDIIDDGFKKKSFQILVNEIINKTDYTSDFDDSNEKNIIDMSHHNIRYASMIIYLYIKIINNENNINDSEVKKQLKAIFKTVIDKDILKGFNWQDYYTFLKEYKCCILKITNNGKDYVRYYDIIVSFMSSVKLKLQGILSNKITSLCPLESIILYYMIEITHQGIYSDITMNELYNIIDIYSKSFNNSHDGHNNCLCKTHFNIQCIETNQHIEKMCKYLTKHYEDIKNIGKVYDTFLQQYPNVNWLRRHEIIYNGTNEDFKLSKKFYLIGYDSNTVFIVYVKPQFNELNLYDTLIESIYDTFLIKNVKNPLQQDDDKEKYNKCFEDFKKFNNKNIITIVFSLDNKNYKEYQWYDLINNKNVVEQIRTKLIQKYINESKYTFSYYKYYRKQNIEVPPKRFIKDFIINYKNDKNYDKMPQFLLRFFQKIEDDISSSKNKTETLEMYDDKETFLNKLHEIIVNSLNEYLDFEEDE